jgi:hypothetical protein
VKIGLIAMSGIRVDTPELARAGLTMPGILERGKVIASLPTLSLLTLAALTPPDIELDYREVRDLAEGGDLPMDYDLVAISSLTAQVLDAYTLADATAPPESRSSWAACTSPACRMRPSGTVPPW